MAIELTDDGTMDTVLRCTECAEEFRYNYDSSDADIVDPDDNGDKYDEFVAWAIEDATAEHVCENDEPSEPQEDDITTSNHTTFYQYGKIVLTNNKPIPGTWAYRANDGTLRHLGTFATCEQAVRAYMDRVQFWPAVWFISDHGNAHLMDLSGK
jgi:hypothetical protein